jgi:hypothetical protein
VHRRGDQRLGVGFQRPSHSIFDGLGRVRLRKAARDEPLGEHREVLAPVRGVRVSPPEVDGRGALKEEAVQRVSPEREVRGGVGEHRADEDGADHALRGEGRQLKLVLGARREADHHGPLGPGRVHHRQAVAGELRRRVAPRVAAAIGAPVAEAVHRQHPEVAREVGDLHLPVARVNQRPGRHQEDGFLALAIDLVEEALAVALDEALAVGVAGAALLAVAADRSHGRRGWCDRGAHGRASKTRLKGVSAARRKRVNPPSETTSPILDSPACAPSASPTSCESDAGVQRNVEKP